MVGNAPASVKHKHSSAEGEEEDRDGRGCGSRDHDSGHADGHELASRLPAAASRVQGGPVCLLPGTVGGPRSEARFVGVCGGAEPTEGQRVQSLVSWRASSSRVGASATRSGEEEGSARAY
jgi:hypothetical protein